MDTIWFGIKLGVGITVGVLIAVVVWRMVHRIWIEIRGYLLARRFVKAGFCWEPNAKVAGWLTRDPNNDDWILWDEENNKMLRSPDTYIEWRESTETLEECLALGRKYDAWLKSLIDAPPKFCSNCGAPRVEEGPFCTKCGLKVFRE